MVHALLLAAGLGTRLRPLTDEWPKCLMPVRGRPLLEYWLRILKNSGVNEILINKHWHADKVDDFLARERYSGWIKSVYELQLLGTAGTLRANASLFRGHTTLLVHADNWCQCDFSAFLDYHLNERPSHCALTMMTFDTDAPEDCGIVETDDQGVVVSFHEKVSNPPGTRANAAVYMIEPEVLEWLEEHPDLSDFSIQVLPHYVGRIATWHNYGVHRDIGSLDSLRKAQSAGPANCDFFERDEWQDRFESTPIFKTLNEFIFQPGAR